MTKLKYLGYSFSGNLMLLKLNYYFRPVFLLHTLNFSIYFLALCLLLIAI